MLITTKRGRTKNFKFNIDLSQTSYVYSDISDIYFVLKLKERDADEDAILIKNAPNVVWTEIETKSVDLSVTITKDEFAEMPIEREMLGGVFAFFIGEDAANEDVKELFKFKVLRDLLIDN